MTKVQVKEKIEGGEDSSFESPVVSAKLEGKQEITKVEQIPAKMPTADPTGMIALIREVAINPNVDVGKMKAILDMQERILDRNAKAEFDAALADMQPDLPTIDQKGRIEIREKDRDGKRTGDVQQSTKYAKLEDINEAIRPIIGKHGFAISFRTGLTSEGKVKVVGILSHRAGHREETTFELPHDTTGSKNAVQAIGSSTSYGKRMALKALLNISERGEDDDGNASGRPVVMGNPITPEELEQIIELADATGCPKEKLVEHMNNARPKHHPQIDGLAQLPRSRFDEAVNAIRNREANAVARAKARADAKELAGKK